MKFNKCPYCNFYNQADDVNCKKCGGPLSQNPSTKSIPPGSNYFPPARPQTSTSYSPMPEENSNTPIVPYKSFSPPARPTPISQPPIPLGSSPLGSKKFGPQYSLPSSFNRFNDPSVEGEVIDVSDIINEDTSGKSGDAVRNVLGAAILPFNPIAGVMTLASGLGKPKPTKSVPVLRIATPVGDIVEVRIDRQLKLGTIRKGDYVSIWGKNNGGVISLWMGFNHSTNAEIRCH